MRRAVRGFIVATLYLVMAAGAAGSIAGFAAARLHYLHKIDVQAAGFTKTLAAQAKASRAALDKKDAQARQAAAEARAQADAVSETDRLRARAYERWVAAQKPKTITITRDIYHVLEINRQWSDGTLPDGVRSALESSATALGAADQPDSAVPAVPAASAADQR